MAMIHSFAGVIFSPGFPHKVATRPCWRCANVLKQCQVESGSESKLELVPKHLRLPLNGDAGGGFRGWKKVICFTSGLILLQRSSSRLLAKSIKIILDIFFGRHQQLFQQFLKTIFARCWKWHLKVQRHIQVPHVFRNTNYIFMFQNTYIHKKTSQI